MKTQNVSATGVPGKRYQDGDQASHVCKTSPRSRVEMGKAMRKGNGKPQELDAGTNSRRAD